MREDLDVPHWPHNNSREEGRGQLVTVIARSCPHCSPQLTAPRPNWSKYSSSSRILMCGGMFPTNKLDDGVAEVSSSLVRLVGRSPGPAPLSKRLSVALDDVANATLMRRPWSSQPSIRSIAACRHSMERYTTSHTHTYTPPFPILLTPQAQHAPPHPSARRREGTRTRA